jgi:hypothetical protein
MEDLMATDTSLLEGEVSENPAEEVNVEKMLFGFLRALLEEQQQGQS